MRRVTWFLSTCRKPPCTPMLVREPSVASTSTAEVTRAASKGSWSAMIPISPSGVRANTKVASPDHTVASGETTSTRKGFAINGLFRALACVVGDVKTARWGRPLSAYLFHVTGLGHYTFGVTDHVEGLLRVLIHFPRRGSSGRRQWSAFAGCRSRPDR